MVLAVQSGRKKEPGLLQYGDPIRWCRAVRPSMNLVGEGQNEPGAEADGTKQATCAQCEGAEQRDQPRAKEIPAVALQESVFEHMCGRAVMFAKRGDDRTTQEGCIDASK